MTPAARVQAAIELVDEIARAAAGGGAAADTLVQRYFKTRRYAGSKDRRAVRDLVYRAIRRAGERPESGRAALAGLAADDPALAALFDGSPHGPAPLADGEPAAPAAIAPAWLADRFDPLLDPAERAALLGRAPLDLRVNTLKGDRAAALAAFPGAAPTPHAPLGLRLAAPVPIDTHPAYAAGLVEIQDEGSQLLAAACDAEAGALVLDLCAGAGGKTLALAAAMRNEGRILAADTDRTRLSAMAPRIARAGVSIVAPRLLDPGREAAALEDIEKRADVVLVDAPCSGSGTWRRNPETRWRLDPARLERLVALQARLLDLAVAMARPGGLVVYAVCSVLAEEGRGQAAALASRHSGLAAQDWPFAAGRRAGDGVLLTPGHDGTDGFFVARWRTPC